MKKIIFMCMVLLFCFLLPHPLFAEVTESDVTITNINLNYSETHVELIWIDQRVIKELSKKGFPPERSRKLSIRNTLFPKIDFEDFGGEWTYLKRLLYLLN